jgi:uncharacterized protein YndB with AHSA1/START domain
MPAATLEPVRKEVSVGLPPDRAFALFADGLGRWWPTPYTYAGDKFETAAIEPRAGGRWYERARGGAETSWGEVRAYEPGRRLVLSFAISPARAPEPPEKASEVEIRFEPEGPAATRVALEHRDFERHGTGAATLRNGMDSGQGWPLILASYERAARERG